MFFLIFLIFSFFALLPCFFIWAVVLKFIPQKYKASALKMTIICFLLSLGTAFTLNFELEGGALSGVVAIWALSLLWAFALALGNLFLKLVCIQKK